ncbi:pirin family protein [Glutamicibacter ardleyensis]|jgi:redox-sensitive bicupin YhaK (pirin superfamily)|uniref:pirin family protein n=1 Tax=Glutamicibacter ardleyensis TaxID=225894 RepID=UPI003FD2BD46
MSNLEPAPAEIDCSNLDAHLEVQTLEPRPVPLGGPRAMTVFRTLPQRQRSLIGAWCFLDHYGPDDVSLTGGMSVPRHPHTGLQTVSWLFSGEIEHIDSAGNQAIVRPGEVNLMTAGYGITHSEFLCDESTILHGAQLWTALPDRVRNMEPTFENYRPEPMNGTGWMLNVFLGTLAIGDQTSTSPVKTHTELSGAELHLEAGAEVGILVPANHEHGLLIDQGQATLNGNQLEHRELGFVRAGCTILRIKAGDEPLRALLIGGEPLGEDILMWWNFVGRTHEEVLAFRAQYQAEIGAEPGDASEDRFGPFPANTPAALPAPALPTVRLRPRVNPS